MNEVLIAVNNVKLNKEADGSWIKDAASVNATGKQGAKYPSLLPNTGTTSTSQTKIDLSLPSYLYKTSEFSQKEVKLLLERYLCPLCCQNSHPLHNCYALKSTHNISLKSATSSTTLTSEPNVNQNTTSTAANRVTDTLPLSIIDEPQHYDGFECVQAPPPDSSSDLSDNEITTKTTRFSDSIQVSKQKEPSNSYYLFVH